MKTRPLQVPPPELRTRTGGARWFREHRRAVLAAAAGLAALLVLGLGSLVLPQLLAPRVGARPAAGGQTTVPEAPKGVGR
jgi:hypothetical protein